MAEVEELCDRVAIVDHGRILAIGTPAELKRRVQRESIFLLEVDRLEGGAPALARLPGVVSAVAPSAADAGDGSGRQTVAVKLTLAQDAALGGVVGALSAMGSSIVALQKSEPTLEDVFVELVGRGFDESEARGGEATEAAPQSDRREPPEGGPPADGGSPREGGSPPDRLEPPDGQPPDGTYVSGEPVESAR
jgi:hypothetical protein